LASFWYQFFVADVAFVALFEMGINWGIIGDVGAVEKLASFRKGRGTKQRKIILNSLFTETPENCIIH